MTINFGSIPMHGWKRIKIQYVGAVCGIALAVAAIGFAVSRDGVSAPAPSALVVPAAVSQSEPTMTRLVYYLVEDETARTHLEASIALDARAGAEMGEPVSNVTVQVLVAGTPEAERRAMNLIRLSDEDAAQSGVFTVEYVDLRPAKEQVD